MELTLQGIHKSFESNHVLKGISFSAKNKAAFGLLGRNGSGKTTTLRIIMDIFSPDSGEVLIDGVTNKKTKVRIGYLPEERGLYPKRIVSEQMIYLGQLRGLSARGAKSDAERLLHKLNATEYFGKRLDTLSKGNQQKIQLAIALMGDPDIIILDEPFSGLDPVNAKTMKELVSELVSREKMVVFSSHQMENVESFCDDICIINHGNVVLDGNLAEIKRAYPRNRIFLLPEDGDRAALTTKLRGLEEIRRIAADISENRNGCVVVLKEASDKTHLLRAIADHGVGISTFEVVEPTLEEIFVEKAGDSNAAI